MAINVDGLKFLKYCSNEELDFLVQIILAEGSLTESLTGSELYKKNSPNHKSYLKLIQEEIITFGNNTFFNQIAYLFDSPDLQDDYKKILISVCDKMDVSYRPSDTVTKIENQLLGKTFEGAFNSLSDNAKKALIQELGVQEGSRGKINAALFIKLFNKGGFESYKMSVVVANNVSKVLLGKGLPFVANATLTKTLSILSSGPVFWLTTLWGIYDLAGPNYKVIIPAVTYIACLRKMHPRK